MVKLLDTFFEYVAVREQRERLGMRLSVFCLACSVAYAVAAIAYVTLR